MTALGLLAVLFVRSARSARETPFEVSREDLGPWALVREPAADAFDSWLALTPPTGLTPPLGRELFSRAGESLYYPNPPSMPVVLRSEFEGALAGEWPSEAILDLAREVGLESPGLTPRCMGRRRVSEPGSTRSVYFLVFEAPAFDRFRQSLAERLRAAGGNAAAFDPGALSPVLVVAATNDSFSRWLPIRVNAEADCLAPIDVS